MKVTDEKPVPVDVAMTRSSHSSIPDATLIRIVQSYYDAVDSMDADRLGALYRPAPTTTLQFNADAPIVTVEAIKVFSAQLFQTVAGIKHSMIEVWTNPLMGDVVPVDLPPPRSNSTVTVVSTALPTFSVRNASGVTKIALPATSIFTIDKPTEKFVSVHNLFDLAKVYAVVQSSSRVPSQGRVQDHPQEVARRPEVEAVPMKELVQVETGMPGLYASAPQLLPFDSSLEIRAFLLQRERGNLLLYGVNTLATDSPAVRDLGGIARRYLNHWHEAMIPMDRIDAPLYCHEKDRESVAENTPLHGTFAGRHMLDDDFEVIPTPGHTSGATAFLWASGGHRYLFTSDTIYLREGEWVATVLGESDRTSYIESLELIRDLDFDVLVPWAATRGQPYYAATDKSDARRRIGAILERVRRGGDH